MFKTITKISAVMGLAMGASFVTPIERAQASGFASSDCGGLNQKTCISLNRNKRCDSGLVEKRRSGRNICVKPSTPGDTTGGCGALNQVTCITPIKSKRCDAGLIEAKQRGRNICIKDEIGADTTPDCGGLDQKSCWSRRASEWCDPGLIYKPGVLPGKGRCDAPETDNMIQYTRSVASRFNALGSNNEFSKLRNCLISPSRLSRLKREMENQDTNGTNAIIRECDVDIKKLQEVAGYMFSQSQSAQALTAARNAGVPITPPVDEEEWDDNLHKKLRFTIEFSIGAAAGSNDVGGTIGYALPLHDKPLGSRWYKGSDDYSKGIDLGAGMDILFGLGFPGVPGGDNATESGSAGIIAAAVIGKVGMLTRITDDGDPMFALFGGAGAGLTVATFEYENEFYEDK